MEEHKYWEESFSTTLLNITLFIIVVILFVSIFFFPGFSGKTAAKFKKGFDKEMHKIEQVIYDKQ